MFDEVINSVWEEVNIWDKLEVSWVTSFASTNRVVGGCLNEDRSSFTLRGEGDRSLKSAADERRYTEDKLLSKDQSSFHGLESKEGSSKVVSIFFKTKDVLCILAVQIVS